MFNNNQIRLPFFALLLVFVCCPALADVLSAKEVYRAASKSVVVVTAWRDGAEVSQGSGVVVAPGKVVTNAHVIGEGDAILIEAGERSWDADWGYVDPTNDLAVVMVEDLPLPPLEIAEELPEIGEPVYALGAPYGLDLTLSDGIVSGVRETDMGTLIQMSAAISQGSSGGALLDSRARLVGVPTMRAVHGSAINFALPATRIHDALAGVAQTERPGEGGVVGTPHPTALASTVELRLRDAADERPPLVGGRYYVIGANPNGVIMMDPESVAVEGDTLTFTMVLRSRWEEDGPRSGYGKEARYRSMLNCATLEEAVLSVTKADYRDPSVPEQTEQRSGEVEWTPVHSDIAGAYAKLLCAAQSDGKQFLAGLSDLHSNLLPQVSARYLRTEEIGADEGEMEPVAAWITPDW